jgi:hypothetical protein
LAAEIRLHEYIMSGTPMKVPKPQCHEPSRTIARHGARRSRSPRGCSDIRVSGDEGQ